MQCESTHTFENGRSKLNKRKGNIIGIVQLHIHSLSCLSILLAVAVTAALCMIKKKLVGFATPFTIVPATSLTPLLLSASAPRRVGG